MSISEALKRLREAGDLSPIDTIEFILNMDLTTAETAFILANAAIIFDDMLIRRTDYLKVHIDKIEENIELMSENIKRITNLL